MPEISIKPNYITQALNNNPKSSKEPESAIEPKPKLEPEPKLKTNYDPEIGHFLKTKLMFKMEPEQLLYLFVINVMLQKRA